MARPLDFWHASIWPPVQPDDILFKRWRGMLRESRGAEVIAELTTLRDSGEYLAG